MHCWECGEWLEFEDDYCPECGADPDADTVDWEGDESYRYDDEEHY